jgi:hypothetical protein
MDPLKNFGSSRPTVVYQQLFSSMALSPTVHLGSVTLAPHVAIGRVRSPVQLQCPYLMGSWERIEYVSVSTKIFLGLVQACTILYKP